jgi:hypothetical protein
MRKSSVGTAAKARANEVIPRPATRGRDTLVGQRDKTEHDRKDLANRDPIRTPTRFQDSLLGSQLVHSQPRVLNPREQRASRTASRDPGRLVVAATQHRTEGARGLSVDPENRAAKVLGGDCSRRWAADDRGSLQQAALARVAAVIRCERVVSAGLRVVGGCGRPGGTSSIVVDGG